MDKKGIILQSILEIVLVVLIVIASVPVWQKFNQSNAREIAKSYENYGVRVNNNLSLNN